MKMKGWKTWASGLTFIGLGAFMIASGNMEQGVAMIASGAGVIGVGHKLEKGGPPK